MTRFCNPRGNPVKHNLIKTGDNDAFPQIQDRNGEVVLDYCRTCGEGEGSLAVSCPGRPSDVDAKFIDDKLTEDMCRELGLKSKRPHLNADGQFQSDKYPTCPPGKVPLSVEDPMAQDLLWDYADRRRSVDADFALDLQAALSRAGYQPNKPIVGVYHGCKLDTDGDGNCPVHKDGCPTRKLKRMLGDLGRGDFELTHVSIAEPDKAPEGCGVVNIIPGETRFSGMERRASELAMGAKYEPVIIEERRVPRRIPEDSVTPPDRPAVMPPKSGDWGKSACGLCGGNHDRLLCPYDDKL